MKTCPPPFSRADTRENWRGVVCNSVPGNGAGQERNGSNRKVAIKVIKSEHDILSFNADINYVDVCKTALQEIKAMEVGVSKQGVCTCVAS